MEPNRKAEIDFELTELQVKLAETLTVFVAGQDVSLTKDVYIRTNNIGEFRYRLSRVTDLLLEMTSHQIATIRVNGGTFTKAHVQKLVDELMANSDELYRDMTTRRTQLS